MSDNLSKLELAWIELDISSCNVVRFDNCPMLELVTLPRKARNARWTLHFFLLHARDIHGNKYDYSRIKESDIKGAHSYIDIICRICKYEWGTSNVDGHINAKNGCPECAGNVPWTLVRFLERSRQIHGNKFNYDKITEAHINGANSCVPIVCKECDYDWEPAINNHINSQSGCPDCTGQAPWTLARFLKRARQIHGDKYDYSKVEERHIINRDSCVDVICCICGWEWSPSINPHINGKTGCPDCAGVVPWTLDRFLIRAKKIHGEKYGYTKIRETDIVNSWSCIEIDCVKCGNEWPSTITNHVHSKSGCAKCKFSKGEIICTQVLDFLRISYVCQYTLPCLSRKRYDFMFTFNDKNIILEYDGKQHFIHTPCFKKSLEHNHEMDVLKTKVALRENYSMIRIDYTQFNNIQFHIVKALQENNTIYYSTPQLYTYISDNL